MKRSRFSEEQIIGILKEHEAGDLRILAHASHRRSVDDHLSSTK
jgi:hypothetical protein